MLWSCVTGSYSVVEFCIRSVSTYVSYALYFSIDILFEPKCANYDENLWWKHRMKYKYSNMADDCSKRIQNYNIKERIVRQNLEIQQENIRRFRWHFRKTCCNIDLKKSWMFYAERSSSLYRTWFECRMGLYLVSYGMLFLSRIIYRFFASACVGEQYTFADILHM